MPRRGLRPALASFNDAIHACARGREWAYALDLFDELRGRRALRPDVRTYNVAMAACGREALRRLDCALDDVAPLWAALDPAALRRGDDGGAEGEGEATFEALLAAFVAEL